MVQADSFIKIFIQSQPVEQTCPCCGAKTKRIHDYRLQEVQDIPLLGKQVILLLRKRRYLCHTAANGSRNPIRSSPATTAGPAGWHFTLSPCSGRPFP
ncbi:MAG: transposase family protein [Enterocloster sp.]